jgi:hypothetical protein
MLGHNDTKTTLRYTRSDVEDVRAAMEAVVEKSQSRHTIGERGRKRKAISNLRPSGHLLPKQALYPAEPRPALRIVRVLISSGTAQPLRGWFRAVEPANDWARPGLCVAAPEIRGDHTARCCLALQQLEHAPHEVPSVKRLGNEILEFDIVPQGRRLEPRGE